MVRYRGAISCRDCAEKQKISSNPTLKPFFFLAGIGCLIGMLTFVYFILHVLYFSSIHPESYIQPLVPFFGGMTITIVLITLGLYAINRVDLIAASIASIIFGLFAAISNALAVYDFITTGPYFVIGNTTYTKNIGYYPMALASYSLFALIAALAILLYMTNTKTDNLSLASIGLLLLSSVIAVSNSYWIIAGPINVVVFAVLFAFFMTRRRAYEEGPIQPL